MFKFRKITLITKFRLTRRNATRLTIALFDLIVKKENLPGEKVDGDEFPRPF